MSAISTQIKALADSLGKFVGAGNATIDRLVIGRVMGTFANKQKFEMLVTQTEQGVTVQFATFGIHTYAILEGRWKRL
jgi:hypothetical protein